MNIVKALFAAAVVAAAHPALTDTYPSKPIRVITANSAGGTSDIFVRALGEELQKRLGQPIVIENRSGGGMNIGGRACAEAPNDGYAICILPGRSPGSERVHLQVDPVPAAHRLCLCPRVAAATW